MNTLSSRSPSSFRRSHLELPAVRGLFSELVEHHPRDPNLFRHDALVVDLVGAEGGLGGLDLRGGRRREQEEGRGRK